MMIKTKWPTPQLWIDLQKDLKRLTVWETYMWDSPDRHFFSVLLYRLIVLYTFFKADLGWMSKYVHFISTATFYSPPIYWMHSMWWCMQLSNIERRIYTQESWAHLENTFFPSGVDFTAWCFVGFKASEAFHIVSFPPWHPWISHITSYCVCQAAANLATALLCPPQLLL